MEQHDVERGEPAQTVQIFQPWNFSLLHDGRERGQSSHTIATNRSPNRSREPPGLTREKARYRLTAP
jgi:hypothetical protein